MPHNSADHDNGRPARHAHHRMRRGSANTTTSSNRAVASAHCAVLPRSRLPRYCPLSASPARRARSPSSTARKPYATGRPDTSPATTATTDRTRNRPLSERRPAARAAGHCRWGQCPAAVRVARGRPRVANTSLWVPARPRSATHRRRVAAPPMTRGATHGRPRATLTAAVEGRCRCVADKPQSFRPRDDDALMRCTCTVPARREPPGRGLCPAVHASPRFTTAPCTAHTVLPANRRRALESGL